MITCIIVDDEPLAIDLLKRYVESIPDLALTGVFEKPMEAFAYLQKQKIDLLFLDIQMPGITGLELIRALQDPPKIILTTAFREFAAEGFDLDVLDYLVKPISKERFLKAINKFYNNDLKQIHNESKEEAFVFLKVDKEMVKLKLDDLLFVEALKNYSRIKTTTKDLIVYYNLSYLEDKLPFNIFKRVHKSFIVNLNKVEKFITGTVIISGKEIPIGKTYQEEVENILKKNSI